MLKQIDINSLIFRCRNNNKYSECVVIINTMLVFTVSNQTLIVNLNKIKFLHPPSRTAFQAHKNNTIWQIFYIFSILNLDNLLLCVVVYFLATSILIYIWKKGVDTFNNICRILVLFACIYYAKYLTILTLRFPQLGLIQPRAV